MLYVDPANIDKLSEAAVRSVLRSWIHIPITSQLKSSRKPMKSSLVNLKG
jgi:hypothetical protein